MKNCFILIERTPSKGRAFLVVIAIIGILAALLLPALGPAANTTYWKQR